MPTLEQVEDALVKADAAGNVDDATILAAEVASMRGAAPQYGLQPHAERTTPLSGAGEFLKQAALPTMGATGGAILGSTLGPVGTVAGESLGSGLGEYANQQLGITPESNAALGVSVLAPPLLRGGMKALHQMPRLLPGSSAALQEEAAIEARQLPSKAIDIPSPSKPLYEQARTAAGQNQTKLAFPKTVDAVKHLKDDEVKALAGTQNDDLIARLGAMEKGATNGLTFDEFDKTIRNLGRKIGGTQDDTLKGTYKLIYKSLLEDAETMKPPVGVPLDLWNQARKMYRKEMARTEFAEMIEGQGIKKVGEMLEQVNPNAIANWMKSPKQEFWRKSLDQGEYEKIEQSLRAWATIPTVPVKRGQPIGSGRKWGMIGAAGAAGQYVGGPMGAAVGMLAADKGSELIARALTSDTGRSMLMKVLRASGGKFGQNEAGMLGALLAGGLGNRMPQSEATAP